MSKAKLPKVSGLKISIKNLQRKLPVSRRDLSLIKKIAVFILSLKRISQGQVNICIVDDKTIIGYNKKYLAHQGPTDCIAFNLTQPKKKEVLADIIISAERALIVSGEFATTPLDELYLYAAHGMLHIIGYDDKTWALRKAMNRKAQMIIKRLKAG